MQQVELFVFVHHLLSKPVGVEWFAAEREHGLRVYVATFSDAAACRVAFGDKDGTFFLAIVLCIAEMYAAIAQLSVVQVGLLCPFACYLGYACYCLSFPFALVYLAFNLFGHVGMDVQIVVYLALNEVAHVLVYAFSAGTHRQRTQFNLRLTFKHGLLYVDGNGSHQSVTYVYVLVVLREKVLNGFGDVFFKCALVRAALRGMLPVYKGVILLAVLVGVGKGNLDVLALYVNDGVKAVVGHAVVQQVGQTIAANDASPVVHDGQTGVKVGVVAEHCFHELAFETIVEE